MCEEDFKRLGGYLASDKEKLRAATVASSRTGNDEALAATPLLPDVEALNEGFVPSNNDGMGTVWRPNSEAVRSLFDRTISQATYQPRGTPLRHHANRNIPESVTIEAPSSRRQAGPPQRRGGARGSVWAWGITRHCDNVYCRMNGTLHRTLYSVGENPNNGMRYESCYPMGSKVIPDGTGGLWIQEARRLGLTDNWPVIHKNRRREVKKFEVARDADIVSDGNGGVWAMSAPDDDSYCCHVKRYMSNSTHDVAAVPIASALFYGPGGKVWINVASDDVYNQNIRNPLEDGLWLCGSHSKQLLFRPPRDSFSKYGVVDSDGVGNLWFLDENENADAFVLKYILANGLHTDTGIRFPIEGTEVYGCGSKWGAFVFHPSPECDDFEGRLTYVSQDETGQWSSAVIGECPTDTKFTSDGKGGLWCLMVDDDDECMCWKCDRIGMTPIHQWRFPFASTELIGG